MRFISLFILLLTGLFFSSAAMAVEEKKFDSEELMSQLEEQIDLSAEKLNQLKPEIDAKSAELKKDIEASVDKGFVELDKLTGKLDAATKATEAKVQEMLSSEQYQQFKDFLAGIDKEAVEDAKKKLSKELSEVLQLTEEQAEKIKPVFEESVAELSALLDSFAKSGMSALDDFKSQYEDLTKQLRDKLKETLDKDQLEKYDEYKNEKRDKIAERLFEA
jgi:hypothetical protein